MKRRPADYWRLFGFLLRSGLRERMQYKANFLITTIFRVLSVLIDFVLLAVILARFRVIDGWDLAEVAVLYGLVSVSRGLFDLLARELEQFEKYLVSGDYDGILVRPWPTVFGLLARKVDVTRLGMLLQGFAIGGSGAVLLVRRGSLAWPALAYLAVLPLCGAAILVAVAMGTAALGFWLVRIDEFYVFTMYAPMTAAVYPISIYPGWLRGLLHTVVPMAFAGYVPVNYLLGKGGNGWSLLAPLPVAVLALWLAHRLWLWGERHYHSTGT